jgi:hypothetical protein
MDKTREFYASDAASRPNASEKFSERSSVARQDVESSVPCSNAVVTVQYN